MYNYEYTYSHDGMVSRKLNCLFLLVLLYLLRGENLDTAPDYYKANPNQNCNNSKGYSEVRNQKKNEPNY